MTDAIQARPSLLGLLATFTVVLVFCIALCFFGLRLWWTYSGQGFPVLVMLYVVPMAASLQPAKQYVKQTGKRAGFGFSLIFGICATLIILAIVGAAWQLGWLDSVLEQIDPSAIQHGNPLRPLTTLLVLIGGLSLFATVAMFWAGTIGEAKRAAKLAAKQQ